MSTMKIRVVKSSMPIYWYSTTIGKEFEVSVNEAPNRTSKGWHILYENGFPTLYAIHVDDFELVNDYAKIGKSDIVYYIGKNRLQQLVENSIAMNMTVSTRDLMLNSDYAINTKLNEVVKARNLIEKIFDKHLNIGD